MLKFIKMKQHKGYLLYYSVLFVVIVVLTVMVLRIEVRDKTTWERLGFALFYVFSFWSAPVKTKTRKSSTKENNNQLDFGTAF